MDNNLTQIDQDLLKKRLKIEWTYRSNAIEGNTISLGDTAFIIENGLTIKGKSIVEHNEVIGHAKAVDLIYEMIKKETLTQDGLFLLHRAIQTNIIIDIEAPIGAYKVVQNARYIKKDDRLKHQFYPYPNDIKYLMQLWFQEYGVLKKIDNFEKCIEIYTNMHISFSSIHPFFDGNGRLARLISNIPLLKSGYLPIIINNENRQEYIELLGNYDLDTKELNTTSINLVEKNKIYYKLLDFFKLQYKNSQRLLDEIKVKKSTNIR